MFRLLDRALLHPFLFAVYPIVFLYAQHQDEVSPRLAVVPVVSALLLAGAALGSSYVLLRSKVKATVFTSFFMLLFFYFNHLIGLFNSLSALQIDRERYQIAIFLLLLLVVFVLVWRSKRDFAKATPILNGIAVFLVGFNLVTIVLASPATSSQPFASESESAYTAQAGPRPPDIYYVILDGYTSSRILRDFIGYDNSGFERFLREQGFYVVPNAYANYYRTNLSLPSSLNMTLLEPSKEFVIPLRSAPENRVTKELRKHGYRVIDPAKDWSTSKMSTIDVENASLADLFRSEFALTLARSTMFGPIMSRLGWGMASARARTLFVLEKFREAPDLDLGGPMFAYIYLVCRHPPDVFRPNGEETNIEMGDSFDMRLSAWDNYPAYIDQTRFVNNQLMEIVPEILSKYPPDEPPIIVIQGDHGPTFTRQDKYGSDGSYFGLRLGILNAYLLPRGVDAKLYEEITPVNTFRLIMNEYLGEDLPLLEDRLFFSDYEMPFDLFDVTDMVRGEAVSAKVQ